MCVLDALFSLEDKELSNGILAASLRINSFADALDDDVFAYHVVRRLLNNKKLTTRLLAICPDDFQFAIDHCPKMTDFFSRPENEIIKTGIVI
jgi:hypothetical protein